MAEQEQQEISIEDLELSLEVYEIESEEKLRKLEKLFLEKGAVDPSKMFYEQRSALQIKFQNIVSDLTEFLINQQIASTDKLRQTFLRLLQNPLIFLFKVSRFEIFNLRLNAFDIELQPIQAILELGDSILRNIDKQQSLRRQGKQARIGADYTSYLQFLQEAQAKLIQDQIFLLYSYLRKGANLIRKKFEDKVRVVELYGKIQEKLLKTCVDNSDTKTLKELAVLNYELYLLQNTFDVLCFYLKVPFRAQFSDSFKELQALGVKAKQSSNYDLFILIFLRYWKEIMGKLQSEGIQETYSSYIENVLTSILELWGCRLCYFQQFFQLFQKLLSLHPKKHQAIQLCLKHSPKFEKDDIVLLRTHFKHDLLQKHSQLLSLLRQRTMEEINGSLNGFYHRILYNLDYSSFGREEIIMMLTTLNGNSSLSEFFGVAERAFKEWNHTIDFTYPHKYIETEYKLPKLQKQKLLESIRLFNNLCYLQQKQFKDFQPLIKSGTIHKAFVDLASFFFNNEEASKILLENESIKVLVTNSLKFLRRTSPISADWSALCLTFTSKLSILSQEYAKSIISSINEIANQFYQSFSIKCIVEVYSNLIKCEKELKINQSNTISSLTNIFMRGIYSKNQQVKLLKFFDSSIINNTLLTPSEQNFLKKYAIINGDTIQPKQNGCFVLSDLQVITNPVQFDKVMDNFYFTLDNNSKRYIHYLAFQWYSLVNNKQENEALILLSFMKNLLSQYPIAIPLLSTTRIYLPNNATKRFVEVLVDSLASQSYDILKTILECRCIRYKNGRDYVKEELAPLVLKAAIKAINQDSTNIIYSELLSTSLKNSRSTDIKTDLIQKAIDVLNYQIVQSKDPQRIYRLSNAKNQLLLKFFQKKQLQMRKKGLQNTYSQLVLSQTRTKVAPIQTEQTFKTGKKVALSDQIMITPFAISQQFNVQQSKLQKTSQFESKTQIPSIELSSLKATLPIKPNLVGNLAQKASQQVKSIDLTNLKYNIQCHLGSQVKEFCLREGYRIITRKNQIEQISQGNDQNITLVQYYLKQFQSSQISSDVVLKYIGSLIEGKVQYSSIFVNFSNLQKLFFGLILIFKVVTGKNTLSLKSDSNVDKILNIPDDKKLQIAKKIMEIFSKIGYHNIWAEAYNSLSSLAYYKQLKQKAAYKQQSPQESFFSWILKICLEKEELRDDLNTFLGSIFSSRPKDQNSLMYRVTIDRALLNLIMKSLSIQNLSYLSLFFHSNFNNLRLYTDQLHEGLKALNMASKNRAYNEYIQLSSDIEDDQFFFPLKLFKENFSFFITIETEGYKSKKSQEEKLGRERILKVLRSGLAEQAMRTQIEKVIEQFEQQLEKLEYNIASRVKSFYLATKLRDFSYQNSLTVCLLHQILTEKKIESSQILKKIKQIQIFSLLNQINNDLVRFQQNQVDNFLQNDRSKAQKQVTISSTKRYSHSISKIYEKCQLQFDEVFQRCIDVLRVFFVSSQGKLWLRELEVYPPFLSKSFLGSQKANDIVKLIKSKANIAKIPQVILSADQNSFSALLKSLREIEKVILLQKDHVKIQFNNQIYTLSQFLVPFKAYLIQSQTLSKSKDGYLLFNKYKTSQKTLEQIQILGLIVGYSVFNSIELDLPLHSSLLNAASFGICDLDDLIDIDFKVWEDLRNVISTSQSKDLNLNFSYIFESLETLKPDRVELVDKGSSKKVNNLNRQQYADSVCCYLLFKIVQKQVNRFLQALIYSCPKLLLSSLSIQQFFKLFLNKQANIQHRIPNYLNQILRRLMKRRALILPPSVLVKQKRYQNSFDYQTIQWFNEIIDSQQKIRQKLWPLEQNIFLCTWMGQGVELSDDRKTLVIGRLTNKEELSQVLTKFA